jgi:sugar lactone lactonase YvrE
VSALERSGVSRSGIAASGVGIRGIEGTPRDRRRLEFESGGRMRRRGIVLAVAAALAWAAAAAGRLSSADDRAGARPFELVRDWPRLPAGWKFGPTSAVAADSRGRIFVAHRGEHPLLCFDRDGKLVRSFGEADVPPSKAYDQVRRWVHGIRVDRRDHVWVTDVGRHVVLEFGPDGKLVRTLGTPGEPGEDATHFNQPTDVAVTRAGEIYVSDGYINSRVVKFAADGKLIRAWGRRGTQPGEFHTPHAIRLDSRERVYVSDRTNSRIQIFDPDGRFLGQWTDLGLEGDASLDGMEFVAGDFLYGSTGRGNKIIKLGPDGRRLETWGSAHSSPSDIENNVARAPGEFNVAHGLCLDRDGNLYVAEPRGQRVQKFRPIGQGAKK